MAEPIRRVAPPARRRPLQTARPQSRLRSVPWSGDETESSPLPQARPKPVEAFRQPSPPLPSRPAASAPSRPPAPEPELQTRTRAFQPAAEKKLRTFLLAALGLHGAALALPFVLPAALPVPSPSDILLAAAVLIAGSAALALGALGRRAG